MKIAHYIILAGVIVFISVFSAVCSRNEPIKIIDSEWGPEFDGLRYGISVEKNDFAYGDPITLTLKVANVSASEKYYRNDVFIWNNLTITYQDGTLIRFLLGGGGQGPDSPRGIKIAPGQIVIAQSREIAQEDYHMCQPGKYTIQWDWAGLISNKIGIEIRKGNTGAIDEIICGLVPLIPDGWRMEVPTISGITQSEAQLIQAGITINKNGRGYIMLSRHQLDRGEAVQIWHTLRKINLANIETWSPYDYSISKEYLGKDKWGYAYMNLFLERGFHAEWPTAKQDIIKALDIQPEKKE